MSLHNSDSCNESSGITSPVSENLHVKPWLYQGEDLTVNETNNISRAYTLADAEIIHKKLSKKSRKKIHNSRLKRKTRIKIELKSGFVHGNEVMDAFEMDSSKESNKDNESVSCNVTTEDAEQPEETFRNHSILNEILNQKKKELLESAEMISFLRSRM